MYNLGCDRKYLFCNFKNELQSCLLNGNVCQQNKPYNITLGNITDGIKEEGEHFAKLIYNQTATNICVLQGIKTQRKNICDVENIPALILLPHNEMTNLTSIFNTFVTILDTNCTATAGLETAPLHIVPGTQCYFYPITTAVTTTLAGTSLSIKQSSLTDITTRNKPTNLTVPSSNNGQTPQITRYTSTEPGTQRTEAVINIATMNTTTLSTNLDTTNESFFFSTTRFNQKTTHPYPETSPSSPTKDNLRSSSSNAVVWGLVGLVVLFVLTFVILASIFIFRRYRKKKNMPKAFYNVAYSVSERNDGEIHISQRDAQGLSQPVDPRVLTYETPISMSQIDFQDDADHYYTIPNNFDHTPSFSCKDNQNSVVGDEMPLASNNEYFVLGGNNSANHDIKADFPAIMPDLLDSVNIYDHLGHGMDVEEDIITGDEYHTLSSVAADTSLE